MKFEFNDIMFFDIEFIREQLFCEGYVNRRRNSILRKWEKRCSKRKTYKFTDIEKMVHGILKDNSIDFKSQFKIGNYRADFLVDNMVIECDGEYWHKDKERDNKRDLYMKSLGYNILRIQGKQLSSKKRAIYALSDVLGHKACLL